MSSTTCGEPLTLPVFLLDDADSLRDGSWEVIVQAYGADLKPILQSRYDGKGSIEKVSRHGEFSLTAEQTRTTPFFVTTDVLLGGTLKKRNYYFTNFEAKKDCLFELPKTKLSARIAGDNIVVTNDGALPAVGGLVGGARDRQPGARHHHHPVDLPRDDGCDHA